MGWIRVLAIADLARHEFLPDVATFLEMGIAVDDASINFRGVAYPKGVSRQIMDKCAEIFPAMFNDGRIKDKMKASGSPMRVMMRDEVKSLFRRREQSLKPLLKDFEKKCP